MYYLLFYDFIEDYLNKRTPFRSAHFEHVMAYRSQGEFIMGGAYENEQTGALVFKVNDRKRLDDFIKNDPYVINGLVKDWTIEQWNVAITSDSMETAKASSPENPTTDTIHFDKATPVLRIFDEQKTRAFYVDFLGFQVDWEHRIAEGTPLYMQISKGNCLIHLTEHHGDCSPGSAIRIPTKNIDVFQKKLKEKKYKNAKPEVEIMPWKSKEMAITDPFLNKITFFETLD